MCDGILQGGEMKEYGWKLRIKYSADQPRVPAGSPEGGRWTSGGYGIGTPSTGEYPEGKRVNVLTFRAMNQGLNDKWKTASQAEQGQIKDGIVRGLSEDTGIPYDDVNEVIKQWSRTASDKSAKSLALQESAAEEFGLDMSDATEELIDTFTSAPEIMLCMDSKSRCKLLRAMYERTQRAFKEAGLKPTDKVLVERGTKLPESVAKDWKLNATVKVLTNPLSSWTIDNWGNTAPGFARYPRLGETGYVLQMEVPVSAIISTARSGMGCLTEGEFIVLGGEHEARVVKVYEYKY